MAKKKRILHIQEKLKRVKNINNRRTKVGLVLRDVKKVGLQNSNKRIKPL